MKREKPYVVIDPYLTWKDLLNGNLYRFPSNFMGREEVKFIFRKYFLEEKKYTREDIITKINYDTLKKIRLSGIIRRYKGHIYEILNLAFPEFEIKEWELACVSNYFFDKKENRIAFMNWICEKENIDKTKLEEVQKLTKDVVDSYHCKARTKAGGHNLLLSEFSGFYPWEFNKYHYWNKKDIIFAFKTVFENRYKFKPTEMKEKVTRELIYKNRLRGMLSKGCSNSIPVLLNIVYPDLY